ncbi:MAG: amidohydrolase family protein [Caldilineaceae bacterium]
MSEIIWAGIAIPAAGADVETDWAVYVEDGRIVDTGSRGKLSTRHPNAEISGGADYLLIPSFVNSHDHGRGIGTMPLGDPDDLLEIWLPGLWTLPPVDPYLLTLWESLQLLKSGVTTTAHSHNPRTWEQMEADSREAIRAYVDAGVRVAFHPPLVDQNQLVYAERSRFLQEIPSSLVTVAERFLSPPSLTQADYLDLCARLVDDCHDPVSHTVHVQISPVGGQWCSDELILACVDFAQARGLRVQMHMLETRYQRIYAHQRWGNSFIRHLDEIGALGPWLTLAHMVWCELDELDLLAERGVGIAHNPSSNLRLRSGVAPVPEMLAARVRVGVGMDGHTLDDDQDYLRELRLAWTLANRPGAASPTVTASTVLGMGTVDGAAITLGADVAVGRLAAGHLADLLLVDWEGVRGLWSAPTVAADELLLRRGSRQQIRHVMVGGEWVIRDGRHTRLNEDDVAAALRGEFNAHYTASAPDEAAQMRALAAALRRFYASWD